MSINDQIRNEKLRYNISREAAKISALSSGKIHKYEYLTGEDILPSNRQQIIEQTKFTYSSLGKGFEKQIKTIEDQGEKHVKDLEDLKPKERIIMQKLDLQSFTNHNTEGTGLKILSPKQMLHRFPIALGQVKAGNNSESLLNEIR